MIQQDTTQQMLTAIDSTWTDSLGYYFFCNVTDSNAFLKATPNAFYYPNEMPTYADATLFWNTATEFYPLVQSPFQHDFSTLYGMNPGGPGFISGLVSQGANKTGTIGDPVPGLRVILRNRTTGDIIGYRETDINGYFSFPAIPLGDYEVVPDKPLVNITNVPLVVLNAQYPSFDSLDFQLHHYWLELASPTAVNEPVVADIRLRVSPNPFGNNGFVSWDLPDEAVLQISVFDMLGRKVEMVFDGTLDKGKHVVSFGDQLHAGVYFVQVNVDDDVRTLRVIKE